MIKKCKVIFRNSINMVVDFDGIELQMPTDGLDNYEVFVNFKDNKYTLSTKDDYEKTLKTIKNKVKKEIIEEESNG